MWSLIFLRLMLFQTSMVVLCLWYKQILCVSRQSQRNEDELEGMAEKGRRKDLSGPWIMVLHKTTVPSIDLYLIPLIWPIVSFKLKCIFCAYFSKCLFFLILGLSNFSSILEDFPHHLAQSCYSFFPLLYIK